MTTPNLKPHRHAAFTLIELLVVISIIALLAGMTIPAAGYAIRKMRLDRARADLHQLQTVIERYKAQKGYYPPDNPANNALPPLFYELTGTYLVSSNQPATFVRINGAEQILQTNVPIVFTVRGFMNSTDVYSRANQAAIREAEAKDFWPGLPSDKYAFYQTDDVTVALLGLSYEGPADITTTEGMPFNVWHYNSSNPTNNPDGYDLWIDLKISSPVPFADPRFKINRICNWSDTPVIIRTNIP